MVEFFNCFTAEDDALLNHSPSVENSDSHSLPVDVFYSEKLDEFSESFADSFLDFDTMDNWIGENPIPVEETKAEDGFVASSNSASSIVDDMEKVSLQVAPTENVDVSKPDEPAAAIRNGDDADKKDEVNESSSESESSDSSSSSSSSSSEEESDESSSEEEENEDEDTDGDEDQKRVKDPDMEEGEIGDSDFASDDEYGYVATEPIRSSNELEVLPPVPQINVNLESHHITHPVGVVLSIIGKQVIVEGTEQHNPLNEGSIIWVTESRSPLGFVDEIFGPVKNPFYVIRFNSEDEIPNGIEQGTAVSFVSEFANHVLNSESLHKKGYDASGLHDEEIDETEFSDDEKEYEYKRSLKAKKKGINQGAGNSMFNKRNKKQGRSTISASTSTWKNNKEIRNAQIQQTVPTSMHQNQNMGHPPPMMFGLGGQPPFGQVVPPSNGVWMNVNPGQLPNPQPQFHPGLGNPNVFPPNGMPWPASVNPPPPQFGQFGQFGQGLMLQGGPSNIFAGGMTQSVTWPQNMGPNGMNQPFCFGMGMQQNPTPTANHPGMIGPPNLQLGNENCQGFNNMRGGGGRGSGGPWRGRGGGGRFRGGRGRQHH